MTSVQRQRAMNGQNVQSVMGVDELPPMLSPTLPPWVDEMLPKRILSPTLPPIFNGIDNAPEISLEKGGDPKRKGEGLSSQDKHHSAQSGRRKSLVVKLKYATGRNSTPATPGLKPQGGRGKEKFHETVPEASDARVKRDQVSEPSSKKTLHRNTEYGTKRTRNKSPGEQRNAAVKPRANETESMTERAKSKPRVTRSYSSSSDSDSPLSQKRSTSARPTINSKQGSSVPAARSPSTTPREETTTESRQRDVNSQILRKKMKRWQDLGREKKHESDAARRQGDNYAASVFSLDSLFSFIVAFDYEDRADEMLRRGPRHMLWSTIIPYITQVIKTFEEQKFAALAGLCYQIRALTQQRIAHSYQFALQRIAKSIDGEGKDSAADHKKLNSEMATLVGKLTHAQDAATSDFRKGFEYLSLDSLQNEFSNTWAGRSPVPVGKTAQEGGYRPMTDPYYVPLHRFSTLQHAAALGYRMANEWAEAHNVKCEWALVKGLT